MIASLRCHCEKFYIEFLSQIFLVVTIHVGELGKDFGAQSQWKIFQGRPRKKEIQKREKIIIFRTLLFWQTGRFGNFPHILGMWGCVENCQTSQILLQFLKTEDPGKKFLTFLDFFPGSTLKIFSWDLRRKIFYWPQIIQTFTRWIIPFQKIQTQNIKEFWKAHGILLPMGLGLPWKI